MHLSYEKLGTDHPMYGKARYIVMDGMNAVCYKTDEGYLPLAADGSAPAPVQAVEKNRHQQARFLFVLSFAINGEAEEITFKSKKKMDKTIALYKDKAFVTDIKFTEYQLAD